MVNQDLKGKWPRMGGALWLDAVNTMIREGEAMRDLWHDFAALLAWARAFGALDAATLANWMDWDASRQARALEGAREVRASLRVGCEELEAGAISAHTLAALNGWIGAVTTQRTLEMSDEGARWHEKPSSGEEAALWFVLASSAGEYLTQPTRPPLRRCEAAGCVLWFLDLTKNRSRRWCSMETCGNRSKVARHYQRRKK